jgi:mRNA interferase MazF
MIRRGEIYFADLSPVRGRKQSGRRPVLVVSNDALNRVDLVVTVVAGTDARNVDRAFPTNVLVPSFESGLPRDTVFLCYQLRSLDPSRFSEPGREAPRRMGKLGPARMSEIDAALRRVLDV